MHEFIAALREFRRPISAIAIGLVVVQALLSGLAGAQAAASAAGYAVFCHTDAGVAGAPGSGPSGGSSGNLGAAHDCCVVCVAAGNAGVAPPLADQATPRSRLTLTQPQRLSAKRIAVAARAVRSGLSTAPPNLG